MEVVGRERWEESVCGEQDKKRGSGGGGGRMVGVNQMEEDLEELHVRVYAVYMSTSSDDVP